MHGALAPAGDVGGVLQHVGGRAPLHRRPHARRPVRARRRHPKRAAGLAGDGHHGVGMLAQLQHRLRRFQRAGGGQLPRAQVAQIVARDQNLGAQPLHIRHACLEREGHR
eukprot:7258634-Prymnesium_polylepis.1